MASLRDIKRRIRSVQNTKQITKAMEMVAAAKLRRAHGRLEAARPYGHKMKEMLENLAGVAAEFQHPLFEVRPVERRALVLITADKGLAGSYNSALLRRAEAYLRSEEGARTDLITIGKKGGAYFRRRNRNILEHYQDLGDQVDFAKASEISREVMQFFLDGTVDEILVLGTRFISAMSRSLVLEKYLPIEPPAGKQEPLGYIFEPNAQAIFGELIPRYVANRMLMSLLEASTSEHGARMVAMGSASRNADDMIDRLTLERNRARQAAITKEISEIVGGAEALK
jgi:F-type H+-transporting ATPase subunit gamma